MPALTGWLALSSAARIDSTALFPELAGYPRVAASFSGSPGMDTQPRMVATPDAPHGSVTRYAGLFDAPTAGYCLAFWRLAETVETPNDLPETTAFFTFELPVLLALNSTLLTGTISELCEISRGDRIGTVNCSPLIAGVRLICVGGSLVRPGNRRAVAVAAA